MEDRLTQAFKQGKPADVWKLTHELLGMSRNLMAEAARARFRVNFGTDVCERCEGLRVSEGVAATCFQVKLCHYDNVKVTPKQRGVLQELTRSSLLLGPTPTKGIQRPRNDVEEIGHEGEDEDPGPNQGT